MTAEPAKVLIVDDHPLVREGLAARISAQPDLRVCGEAADTEAAFALLIATKPALMIVDLSLKSGHGLELIKRVKSSGVATRMLVVSAYEDSLFAERSLLTGAHGYINKQEAQEKVIDAIRTVLRGERYLSPALAQVFIDRSIEGGREPSGVHSLSNREMEVFELIGGGKGTREIAEQLRLSMHTVESHREKIRSKLGLDSGTELVRRAVEWVLQRR